MAIVLNAEGDIIATITASNENELHQVTQKWMHPKWGCKTYLYEITLKAITTETPVMAE